MPLLGVAAAVLMLALLAPAAPADRPVTYYVSLGDSLARGWQPDAHGHSRETSQGYVDYVAGALAKSNPGLRTIKFGCGGETTGTMLAGGVCHYAAGSQLAQAEHFLKTHAGRIAAVSVNIGDNDVEGCLASGAVDGACVQRELARVRSRLPRIAARLRAAAGTRVPVAGLADYDQFLAYWLRGPAGRQFATASVNVVLTLNRSVSRIYRAAKVASADGTDAFSTRDIHHHVALPGHGLVPRAVQRVCAWTWACSGPPVGFNDHANTTGYRVLGRRLAAALQVR